MSSESPWLSEVKGYIQGACTEQGWLRTDCSWDIESKLSIVRHNYKSTQKSHLVVGIDKSIPLTKASRAGLWCFLWHAPEQTVDKHRDAGDLRRHRAHYDVIVMTYHKYPDQAVVHKYWTIHNRMLRAFVRHFISAAYVFLCLRFFALRTHSLSAVAICWKHFCRTKNVGVI